MAESSQPITRTIIRTTEACIIFSTFLETLRGLPQKGMLRGQGAPDTVHMRHGPVLTRHHATDEGEERVRRAMWVGAMGLVVVPQLVVGERVAQHPARPRSQSGAVPPGAEEECPEDPQ